MKKEIHPNYSMSKVNCNSCNTIYNIGSTVESMKVELCSNCHPYYTGKQVLVDTDNLVDKFNKRKEAAVSQVNKVKTQKEKNEKRKGNKPGTALTLKDMLSSIK